MDPKRRQDYITDTTPVPEELDRLSRAGAVGVIRGDQMSIDGARCASRARACAQTQRKNAQHSSALAHACGVLSSIYSGGAQNERWDGWAGLAGTPVQLYDVAVKTDDENKLLPKRFKDFDTLSRLVRSAFLDAGEEELEKVT